MSTPARIVITTTSSREEGERIARHLVDTRLAACVNILPAMTSIYCWQGAVESAEEVMLLIKTAETHLEAIQSALQQLHSYEIPEFVVLTIDAGSSAYLTWLVQSVE